MNRAMLRPAGLPATSARIRAAMVVLTTVTLMGAVLVEAGGTSAATIVQAWQTRVGTQLTDTSTLTVYSTGSGILRIRATKMRASSTFAVTVYKGTCGRYVSALGPVLFTLPSATSSSSGAITRNLTVSATRVKQVRASWNAGAGVALVLRRGSSRWCGDFAALGTRGKTVRLENLQYHVVSRAERWEGTGRAEPEPGGAYVTIYVRIKAIKKTSYDDGTYTLRDPTGTDWRRPIVMWDVREPALGSGELLAGQTAEGWITTIAPEEQLGSLTLVYRMHASGYILGSELVTLLVPLGTLAQPMPSPSPSPDGTPVIEPTPTPGI
jgi:hypothetical protein